MRGGLHTKKLMNMSGKTTFLSLLFWAAMNCAYPQPNFSRCGTTAASLQQIQNRLWQNKRSLAQQPLQPRSSTFVPIHFHMVAENDGSGAVRYKNLLDQLCALNEDFAEAGIQFYMIMNFSTINDSEINQDHFNQGDEMELMRDYNAINVWIVDDVYTPNPNAISDGAYQVSKDWLIIRESEINDFSVTLTHEMGHFFGLLHPFHGWDFEPWTIQQHGNPAPAMSPGNIPTERQNGTNCDVAGDYVCDTPPDYNFGFFAADCTYNPVARDPLGVLVEPDKYNFMTYFDRCDRTNYRFSPMQRQLMRLDLGGNARAYIRSDEPPAFAPITAPATLELPAWNAQVPTYNAVPLDWQEVAGATHYLVEVDLVPSFTLRPESFVVDKSEIQLSTLQANRTYYWRVRPFNAYHTCSPFSDVRMFQTGDVATSTQNIRQLTDWTIIQNPVPRNTDIEIAFNISEQIKTTILLQSMTGQNVLEISEQRFGMGDHLISLPTNGLRSGLYFLTLQTQSGRLTKKIIIQ